MTVPPDDPRLPLCGFARLASPPGALHKVDAILRKRSVVLGRKSKSGEADVVLSADMAVSRHHAILRWMPPPAAAWELIVLGKNGVTVNGDTVPATPGGADAPLGAGRALASHDVLAVGEEVEVEFLLPVAGGPELKG